MNDRFMTLLHNFKSLLTFPQEAEVEPILTNFIQSPVGGATILRNNVDPFFS